MIASACSATRSSSRIDEALAAADGARAPRLSLAQPDGAGAADNPGIIDFQDALAGPCGYDLVSLLKDCYIDWPRARVEAWVLDYREQWIAGGGDGGRDAASFCAGSIWSACSVISRCSGSSPACGIATARPGYLADLPRTLDYVCDAARAIGACANFVAWVERR